MKKRGMAILAAAAMGAALLTFSYSAAAEEREAAAEETEIAAEGMEAVVAQETGTAAEEFRESRLGGKTDGQMRGPGGSGSGGDGSFQDRRNGEKGGSQGGGRSGMGGGEESVSHYGCLRSSESNM